MLLTIDQAAASLAISRRTLLREIAAGRLVIVEIRGATRIAESDLAAYIDQSRTLRATACPSSATLKPAIGAAACRSAGSESSDLLDRLLQKPTRRRLRPQSAAIQSTAASANLKRAA